MVNIHLKPEQEHGTWTWTWTWTWMWTWTWPWNEHEHENELEIDMNMDMVHVSSIWTWTSAYCIRVHLHVPNHVHEHMYTFTMYENICEQVHILRTCTCPYTFKNLLIHVDFIIFFSLSRSVMFCTTLPLCWSNISFPPAITELFHLNLITNTHMWAVS